MRTPTMQMTSTSVSAAPSQPTNANGLAVMRITSDSADAAPIFAMHSKRSTLSAAAIIGPQAYGAAPADPRASSGHSHRHPLQLLEQGKTWAHASP